MAKVITFSRVFPKGHPREGQPTYFLEKLTKCFHVDKIHSHFDVNVPDFDEAIYYLCVGKRHTIRTGKRFKQGEYFSPRVWSDKPYRSPQITIAPDIKIVKTIDIGLRIRGDFKEFYCNDEDLTSTSLALIAKNDGLELNDFLNWFEKPFEGQIICWSEVGY